MEIYPPQLPTTSRVLLVELGGVTWDVLSPLVASGNMPHLAELLRASALADLHLGAPPNDRVAWATLASGGGPDVHGLLEECHLDHRQRRIVLGGAASQPSPTLVDHVASADPKQNRAPIAVASSDAARWRRRPATFDDLCRSVHQTQQSLLSATDSAIHLDRTTDWRLLVVRFREFDSLLHYTWHALGIGHGPGAARHWVRKAREVFHTLDGCLGRLLALADRQETAVVLVSPHGFAPFRERIAVCELLRQHRLLYWAQGWEKARHRLSRLAWRAAGKLDAGPTCWKLEGLQLVDMKRTRAVNLHGQSAALVYLNVPERFGARVLDAPRRREEAAAQLLEVFQTTRHPATDEPLFEEVYLTASRYDCDPLSRGWPELVAIPAAGFCIRLRLGGRLLRPDATLSAARTGKGFLGLRAPRVTPGHARAANVADVAPTVLTLLGMSPPESMTGRVLREMYQQNRSVAKSSHVAPRAA